MFWLVLVVMMLLLGALVWSITHNAKMLGELEEQLQESTAKSEKLEQDVDRTQAAFEKAESAYKKLRNRVSGLADADDEKDRVVAETKEFAARFKEKFDAAKIEFDSLNESVKGLREEHQHLSDEAAFMELGFFEQRFDYRSSATYKYAIEENITAQKTMLKDKQAAVCNEIFTIDGDAKQGKKWIDELVKLMLRAFNGECDAAVGKVSCTNYKTMENRLSKSFSAINKLAKSYSCEIEKAYFELKIEHLRLAYEYEVKLRAERDEQREIKDQMRQEAAAEREMNKAKEAAEQEERQYELALERAREELSQASADKQSELEQKMRDLEERLAEAHQNKERAISRAQQTRSGHVYIISNIGSFGQNVYKIGMTRRLEPLDRVSELSDASVPFNFDVHAIIYSKDAPSLEKELHNIFSERRLNIVNQRKEFFYASMDEISKHVREHCGDIEITLAAEASQFYESEAHRRAKGLPLHSDRHQLQENSL
jgi:hypothetical protein